ncbi:MAG: MgtC/SapB family protein [Pseudomonadota bacterium]
MDDLWTSGFRSIDHLDFVLCLVCAVLAGGLLGLDREMRHRKVGVRTYMLVSLGAAGFSILTIELAAMLAESGIQSDPTRIVQGLIGAIGFLGAGAIIQGDDTVGGMATAASLWVAGAVGMASGLGFFVHAAVIAASAALVLAMSRFMSNRGAVDRPDE